MQHCSTLLQHSPQKNSSARQATIAAQLPFTLNVRALPKPPEGPRVLHLHGELQKGDVGFLTPGESTPHSSTTEAWSPVSSPLLINSLRCSQRGGCLGHTIDILYTHFFWFPWKQSRGKAQARHPPTTKLAGSICNPVLRPHQWPHHALFFPQSPRTP